MTNSETELKPNANQRWNVSSTLLFVVAACGFYWAFSIAGSFGPQIQLTIPKIQFAISAKLILLMSGVLVPAVACLFLWDQARESLLEVRVAWQVYFISVVVGILVPFASYFGSHYALFPWDRASQWTLIRVFFLNLLLSPMWEEIIWRGHFLKRLMSFVSAPKAIAISAVAWMIWHGGYIAFLYSEGLPASVLLVLPFLYFCSGIILGSTFVLGNESLWPCVLLHAGFNASTVVYYTSYDRAAEFSSYVSELIVAAIAASVLFHFAIRRQANLPAALVPPQVEET